MPSHETMPGADDLNRARVFSDAKREEVLRVIGASPKRNVAKTIHDKAPAPRRVENTVFAEPTFVKHPRNPLTEARVFSTQESSAIQAEVASINEKRKVIREQAADLLSKGLHLDAAGQEPADAMKAQSHNVALSRAIGELRETGRASAQTKELLKQACEDARTELKERAAYLLAMKQDFRSDTQYEDARKTYEIAERIESELERGLFKAE